jgi:hypothetical protein
MSGETRTVLIPESLTDFEPNEPEEEETLIGTAGYADCIILERRLVMSGEEPTLEYHKTEATARVFLLSATSSEIEPGTIGVATLTDEGYWELTSVMC